MGSTVALGIQTPQIASPLQNLGEATNIQSMLSQTALRGAQTRQADAEAQNQQAKAAQEQRDLADQTTIQQYQATPENNAKIHAGDISGLGGKISAAAYDKLQKDANDNVKALAANDETHLNNTVKAQGQIAESVNNLLTTFKNPVTGKTDTDRLNAALPGLIEHLGSTGTLKMAGMDPQSLPGKLSDPDTQIPAFLSTLAGAQAAHESALKLKQQQATTTKAEGEATVQTAIAKNLSPTGLTPDQQRQQTEAGNRLTQEASQFKVTSAETGKHDRATEAAQTREGNLKQQEFEAQYGAPGEEGTIAKLSEALKGGRADFATVKRMKGGEAALSKALSEDPSLTEERYKTIHNFFNAGDGKDLAKLDMLDHHLDSFKKASDEEGTRINPLSGQASKLATVGRDVAGVMGQLVKGNSLTQAEGEDYMHKLNSPFQTTRQGALDGLREMIEGKKQAAADKYRAGTGGMELTPQQLHPVTGGGGVKEVGTQAEYDALPSGATYTENGKKFKKP